MRILVGFSGGLDSMMTAALLLDAGHTVEGAVVQMHTHTDTAGAKDAAATLGIPLHEIDATATFTREVIDNFVAEYKAARTPNPCVRCNRFVKIGALADFATRNGFDGFATGHYARIVRHNGRFASARAKDAKKDQSYMLWQLSQEMLAAFHTPLADYDKETLRAMARARGFAVADKPESQDICFLPDGGYADFIAARAGESPCGNFVLTDGTVVGKHRGLLHYTVGQRKGLGIALGEPMFVTALRADTNEVVLAPAGQAKTQVFSVSDCVWSGITATDVSAPHACFVALRYHAPLLPAVVQSVGDTVTITLDEPTTRAVTPGQSAVCYNADGMVLFGGLIL